MLLAAARRERRRKRGESARGGLGRVVIPIAGRRRTRRGEPARLPVGLAAAALDRWFQARAAGPEPGARPWRSCWRMWRPQRFNLQGQSPARRRAAVVE